MNGGTFITINELERAQDEAPDDYEFTDRYDGDYGDDEDNDDDEEYTPRGRN
jgi:hypothetical protein